MTAVCNRLTHAEQREHPTSWARAFVRSVWTRLAAYHQRRATFRELSALDERTLRDIGVSRGQIPNLAKHAALMWSEPPRGETNDAKHRRNEQGEGGACQVIPFDAAARQKQYRSSNDKVCGAVTQRVEHNPSHAA